MFEQISQMILTISGGNESIAAGVSVALTGSLIYSLKALPQRVFDVAKRQLTTTLTYDNSGWGDGRTIFNLLNKVVRDNATQSGSRTVSVCSIWDEEEGVSKRILNVGYGSHIFTYKGKIVLDRVTQLDSSGSDIQKIQTSLTYFGRDYSIFESMLDSSGLNEIDNKTFTVSEWRDKGWHHLGSPKKRGLDCLALNQDIRDMFKKEFDRFISSEGSFTKLGLPYKMTFLLHGVPGSGKTSIVKALASDYNMNVCVINLASHSDDSFSSAINSAPKKSIILIEDFDSSSSVKAREQAKSEGKDTPDPYSMLTLSGVLNTLDGICSLDEKIIFLTTNVKDSIDPAVYRSGRVDNIVELPKISSQEVKRYLTVLYPVLDKSDDIAYKPMAACKINDLVFKCKGNSAKLIETLRSGDYEA